ncbi:hypothetical protein [Nocardia sp. NPDC060249]|uniref:hypothetical protein n=1 Tax=Nocardia sp. NPDC060249 TaxID=3347082 RepID=UPI003657047D
MTEKLPNKFAGAPCATDEHTEWMRKHRGSRWDWLLAGEDKHSANRRRAASAAICTSCPLTARKNCAALHAELVDHTGYTVPGVWAGEIYRDKVDSPNRVNLASIPTLPFEAEAEAA